MRGQMLEGGLTVFAFVFVRLFARFVYLRRLVIMQSQYDPYE